MKAKWRTVRILVEIPVFGNISDRQVISTFRDSFDHDLPRLDVLDVGNVQVKSYSRVRAANTRGDK